MKKWIFPAFAIGFLVLGLALIDAGNSEGVLLRVSDGTRMTLNEVLPDLREARLIFFGELHDRQSHHDAQLQVIRALHTHGVPLTIGLEMFQEEDRKALNQWTTGALSEETFTEVYYRNWNLPWSLYRDIFHYAREEKIPMIGLNIPREIVHQVAQEGFASLTPEQRAELPPVTCAVDERYKEFVRRALGLHAHGNMDFTHFCEAQLLWDHAMAMHLLDYLAENPKRTVVVLAGNGHAWKEGIPRQIESRSQIPYRVILPEMPGTAERDTVTTKDADYVWLVEEKS